MIAPHLEIVRLEDAFPEGMFGAMLISTRYFCVTLEPPENANKRNTSCIPAGQYEVMRIDSPKFGPTFQIINVPDRDLVEFHPGNVERDTHGCVLLGDYIAREQDAIRNSRAAFNRFIEVMKPYDSARLTIKEHWR